MTTLAAEELKTTLTESITLTKDRIYHMGGLKIKLVMFNAPSGTFTLSLKQGATTHASKDFTSADIKTDLSTSNNYAWIWKAIEFSNLVALKKGVYDLVLSSNGYTHSAISFLAWTKSFESIFPARTDAFIDYTTNPLDVLIYERMREDLTR